MNELDQYCKKIQSNANLNRLSLDNFTVEDALSGFLQSGTGIPTSNSSFH